MLTPKQLEDYLTRAGLRYERVDETTIGSAFRGQSASFPFFIRLTEDWIFFTITPFVGAPPNERALLPLYRRLLELNRTMNLAKFALDEDLDVLLTVELPTEDVSATELDDALNALSFYADAHYAEVKALQSAA
jgi:hypothetical protein